MEVRVAKDDHADGVFDVFAFGSNLDLRDFVAWCRRERGMTPQIERRSWAWLRDYRFSWDYYSPVRRGGAANINPAAGHSVAGVVFKVDTATLAALDAKEGHPQRYLRQKVTVECMDEPREMREVWTYRVTPTYRTERPVKPTKAYIDIVLKGIAEQGLPAQWRAEVVSSVEAIEG